MSNSKGKLFVVDEDKEISVFSFNAGSTSVINHILQPGVYLLVKEYNELFSLVLTDNKIFLARHEDIKDLII